MSAPRWRLVGARSLAFAVSVVVLVTIDGLSSAPIRARDLSGAITAVRGGQIAAESSMRAADKRIASLKRSQKGAERHLRKLRVRYVRVIDRRTEARARARAAAAELAAARAELARREEELATLMLERDILAAAFPGGFAATADLTITSRPDVTGPAGVSRERSLSASLALDDPGSEANVDRLERSIAELEDEVARLLPESRHAERMKRRVERTTRRSGRRVAAEKRRIRSIRRGIRSATAQQHGAEASLAAYIRSMTRLAYLRANKKTKGRAAPDFVMPVHGRISQGYHAGHDGLDIVAGRGAPIRAMGPGVVAYVGWNPWDSRPRAFVVVLAHQGGYETKYGHLLPRRGVVHGELVRRGEIIGYMGNTGHSTGVHLHLEVSRGFHTINPYSVL